MSRDDPIEKWHCCGFWQRKLANKWNAREFAQKLGIRVPDLYWYGRNIRKRSFETLPRHFVIRPIVGHSCRNVFVMDGDINRLDGKRYTEDEIKDQLQRDLPFYSRKRVLVEAFVKTEDGRYTLPHEYKCYVFGQKVAAISVQERDGRGNITIVNYYTSNWERMTERITKFDTLDPPYLPPPGCRDELLACARTLGSAYGTFVRVDMYATDQGAVFGEFAATPQMGAGFTDYADQYFERCWQEVYPDTL